jgi:hypothetical protein
LFEKCPFSTLNALAETGLVNEEDPKAMDMCQTRAWWAIRGKMGYSTHNYYNYQHYLSQVEKTNTTQPKKNIAVIRTEHLQDDWRSIEEDLLDGTKGLNITFGNTKNASPKRQEDLELSPIAQSRLCHALCHEIQVYKELLRRAKNLNEKDVATSMEELRISCPIETDLESCRGKTNEHKSLSLN